MGMAAGVRVEAQFGMLTPAPSRFPAHERRPATPSTQPSQ